MRPSWEETWMNVADVVARRSFCIRKYGAAIVNAQNVIIATGYNGPPANLTGWHALDPTMNPKFFRCGDCREYCPHARLDPGEPAGYNDCFSIHAEANALMFCDRTAREGGTIYVTTLPCFHCAKMIANSGLHRVAFRDDRQSDYRGRDSILQVLRHSGLETLAMT